MLFFLVCAHQIKKKYERYCFSPEKRHSIIQGLAKKVLVVLQNDVEIYS